MQSKNKSPRNKTLSLSPSEAKKYLGRCLSADRPLPPRPADRTIVGDSFAVMEQLPKSFVDLAIVDPPYNLTKDYHGRRFTETGDDEYAAYTENWIEKLQPLLKPDASLYVCCDWKSSLVIGPVLKNASACKTASPGSGKRGAALCATGKRHGRHLVCHLFRPLHLQS